jgi:hypothetical protein
MSFGNHSLRNTGEALDFSSNHKECRVGFMLRKNVEDSLGIG